MTVDVSPGWTWGEGRTLASAFVAGVNSGVTLVGVCFSAITRQSLVACVAASVATYNRSSKEKAEFGEINPCNCPPLSMSRLRRTPMALFKFTSGVTFYTAQRSDEKIGFLPANTVLLKAFPRAGGIPARAAAGRHHAALRQGEAVFPPDFFQGPACAQTIAGRRVDHRVDTGSRLGCRG